MNVSAQEIHGQPYSLSTRLHRDLGGLREITPAWIELYHRCPSATPFQRPEWQLAWIESFSPRELFAVELREGQRLAGLAIMLIYSRDGQRVLAFAGGGVSDYLGTLCEPGREEDLLRAAVGVIDADWDVLELTDLHPENSLLELPALKLHVAEHDFCSVLELPQSQDELLHLFSKRQRANLRHAQSRLQRAGGGAVESATQQNLPEFLDDLFRLHTTRWTQSGQPGVLHDELVRQFHHACAPAMHAAGILKIHRLRIGEKTAAILYSLWDRDTVFCYLQGHDLACSALSPGTQLMFAVMTEAVEAGMRRFDFLRGGEAYKQHWRPRPSSSFRITLTKDQFSQLFLALSEAA